MIVTSSEQYVWIKIDGVSYKTKQGSVMTERNVTTVGGIEMFNHHPRLDTSADLLRCPFCGYEAGYDGPVSVDCAPGQWIRVECSNSSCRVATPFHYRTREDARDGWNRRTANPEVK